MSGSSATWPEADFVVHNLSGLILFPKPYRGKGTPVNWSVEQKSGWSIASKDGRIVWLGPATRLFDGLTVLPETEFFNGHGLVAIPGFVDSHTHLVYAGDRSDEFDMRVEGRPYLDILAAGGGILRTTTAVRNACEDELFHEAARRLIAMTNEGVTTIEIKTGYGLDLETELKMLRVIRRLDEEFPVCIVPTFMGAHAIPADRRDDPDGFVDEICREWIPEIARTGLAVFNDVFTENKAFSVEQSRKILTAGVKHGLKPKIHADEVNRLGGIELAVELGAVSADHLLVTNKKGIAKLKDSGVIPTVLPGTSTYLMESHHAPARDMIEAGLPLAIASDHNPGSSQFLGGQIIQSLAMLQLRMTSSEALVAGTLHAAHALELGFETGSIEVGKRMDLALLELDSYRQLGYRIGHRCVYSVIIDGRPFSGA